MNGVIIFDSLNGEFILFSFWQSKKCIMEFISFQYLYLHTYMLDNFYNHTGVDKSLQREYVGVQNKIFSHSTRYETLYV